jgi:hypothetical protein
VKKFVLAVILCCSFVGSLFAKKVTIWTGYAGGKEIKNAWITGVDALFYDVNKNITLGVRLFSLEVDRKEYEIGTGKCGYGAVLLGGMYHTKISENFEFDTRFFVGSGHYYRKGSVEGQKEKERYLTAFLYDCDLSVGARYNFTRKFGLGLCLGYRHCFGIDHKSDDKFNLSGFQTTLNFCIMY